MTPFEPATGAEQDFQGFRPMRCRPIWAYLAATHVAWWDVKAKWSVRKVVVFITLSEIHAWRNGVGWLKDSSAIGK